MSHSTAIAIAATVSAVRYPAAIVILVGSVSDAP